MLSLKGQSRIFNPLHAIVAQLWIDHAFDEVPLQSNPFSLHPLCVPRSADTLVETEDHRVAAYGLEQFDPDLTRKDLVEKNEVNTNCLNYVAWYRLLETTSYRQSD